VKIQHRVQIITYASQINLLAFLGDSSPGTKVVVTDSIYALTERTINNIAKS
jgi:hypothetical protein